MSCGDMHDPDCSSAQQDMYEYLHYELDPERLAAIRAHLKECGECLEEFSLEEVVRELLYRSCHCTAPAHLRSAVKAQLTGMHLDPEILM